VVDWEQTSVMSSRLCVFSGHGFLVARSEELVFVRALPPHLQVNVLSSSCHADFRILNGTLSSG